MLTFNQLNKFSGIPRLELKNKSITSDMVTTRLAQQYPDIYDNIIKQITQEENTAVNSIQLADNAVYDYIEMVNSIIIGRKVNAIKLCRKISDLGLKDAKDYVEQISIDKAKAFISKLGDDYPALVI